MKTSVSRPSSAAAPEKAILVVGSGYGALKVAQDLAQSGLPLIWVTKALHFLELPGGHGHFTEWPEDLDFQFRPLYLRITRHPLVTALTQARVESIEKTPEGFRAVIVQNPLYIDYDLCTGCGRCMEVCPLADADHPPLRRTPPYCPSRALDLDKRKPSPCRTACPIGVNVQAYMALAAASRFDEALAVIREVNPLPGVCGRVCHHPCEAICRRGEVDEPIAICSIKRFLADWELTHHPPRISTSVDGPKRTERIAVIGAGPAGLTAAHVLNQAGFPATVFEAHPEAGGMLRVGINAFRLPRPVLDQEIRAIVESGVEIRTNTPVKDLNALFDQGFRAILLCTGAHRDLKLGIPGEENEGVLGAVEMLRAVNSGQIDSGGISSESLLPRFGHVAVIGGGNSAIDAARAAIRLGAKSVTICYRRDRADMPARLSEIEEAEEEGITIEFRVAPARVLAEKGKVNGIELIRMKMGKPDESGRKRPVPIKGSEFIFRADQVIVAVGQESHLDRLGLQGKWKMDRSGLVLVDRDFATDHPDVFAAGDIVTGPDTVVGAMAQGRQAAFQVINYLISLTTSEVGLPATTSKTAAEGADYLEIPKDAPHRERMKMPKRQPQERRGDFGEVETGFSAEQAIQEAERCLQCSSCCECGACKSVCEEVGAIDHGRPERRFTVTGPAVIAAAEDELPREILKQSGVYRVGKFKRATDIVNVLMAGSASAGLAMAEGAELRIQYNRRNQVEAKTEMGDEGRLGVFICTCNDTLASKNALERIREIGRKLPGVVHSELIFSACHPRGANQIADAVRTHGLGRVIMASCVCCPLEFQCISCNDQRNRARLHLFSRLGLDRSRFEMINVRDHLGSAGVSGGASDDLVVASLRDDLREAFIRSKFLGPLRSGTTRIGNRILILGGSEVGLSCAQILDLQGFRIRLVHRCALPNGKGLPDEIRKRPVNAMAGKRITHVPEAIIEGIQGHLGDFEVFVQEDGRRRTWKADIVCLADLNMLPLAMPAGMFGLKKFYRYNFAFFQTPQIGIYRVMPRTLRRVTAFQAGAALAAHVVSTAAEAFLKDHELSPKIDPERCRGCGRCVDICPFDAARLKANDRGFYTAEILRHNCVGCGGCVGLCPVTAIDMPYFSNRLLEEMVVSTLTEGR